MPTLPEKADDIRGEVFLGAGVVTCATLLLTSGLNWKFMNQVLSTAKGGKAGVAEVVLYWNVVSHAFALVAAILITAAIVRFSALGGYPLMFALIFVWGVAAVVARSGDPTAASQVSAEITGGSGGPPGMLIRVVLATFTAYTVLLAVQATAVGTCTIWSFVRLREKWS